MLEIRIKVFVCVKKDGMYVMLVYYVFWYNVNIEYIEYKKVLFLGVGKFFYD